ncbi:hypothetical protein [Larkinella soli]|uniref:hypothetical protein n=1 Tax=Larkinella soli TaxID=1770527 RepID=UPI000FFBECA7|nr:hypothetical protein [Larkinella soli]
MNSKRHPNPTRRWLALCCLLPFLPACAGAQPGSLTETPGTRLSLRGGLQHLNRSDRLLSPRVYLGSSPTNVQLALDRTRTRTRTHLSIGFAQFDIRSQPDYSYLNDRGEPLGTFPTSTSLLNIRYGYARRLGSRWAAGLMSDNQLMITDQAYGRGTYFNYLNHFSLSPWLSFRQPLTPRLSVSAQTWFPVVSWVSRSPYAVQDDQYMRDNMNHQALPTLLNYLKRGEIQSVDRFQKVNAEVRLTLALTRSLDISAAYQIEYLRNTTPRLIRQTRQMAALGICLKI